MKKEFRFCIEYVCPTHPFNDDGSVNIRHFRTLSEEEAENALVLLLECGCKLIDLYRGNVQDGKLAEWSPLPMIVNQNEDFYVDGDFDSYLIKKNNMTPEGKELVLKDLCARLPYGVKVQYNGSSIRLIQAIGIEGNEPYFKSKEVAGWLDVWSCKPYLRPMSSMTEEEKVKLSLSQIYAFTHYNEVAKMDWLNEHHFDYRDLIEKGLAIEVTEDNNPYKD